MDYSFERLVEEVSSKVMKIVNKHHSQLKVDVASYRHDVKNLSIELKHFKQEINDITRKFNGKHESFPERLQEISEKIDAHAIGVQNVYNEFKKYQLSELSEKIDALNARLEHYEKEKNVSGLEINIRSFPMNVSISINIITNFGQIKDKFNYPPALEYKIGPVIGACYSNMLDKLYSEHDKRGGRYIGDEDCKKWLDENGETIIDLTC